ncbi:unnamed protein product [Paramecium octaurelia]|uniref:non-specific serine/threonine protein kinase n=1 Tax=Paramecium octaurelia TaxID=43137 RepID=A0A8S1VSP6_PAROT|nr:unnamed protein product [Paramecium octaurelia]
MIIEVKRNEDLLVICRICEKKLDAHLITNHLTNCQQIYETKMLLQELNCQIHQLAEQAQNKFRTTNTKYQIHKAKQTRQNLYENGKRQSVSLNQLQLDGSISDGTGSKTNKASHQNTGKSHFALIGAQNKAKMHAESDQIVEMQNKDQSIQNGLFDQNHEINVNQIKGKQRANQQYIHSPQREILQGSSPSSNGLDSPVSFDDNIDILKDLRQQLNCLKIIINYTEETIKINSGTQSIQFDLQTQVNLMNTKDFSDKELQDIVKLALKLIEERVQYTQKISRLQKLISEEDKQDNINSPLGFKQNTEGFCSRSPKRSPILQNCEKSKWLNKQNVFFNYDKNNIIQESSFKKSSSDFGDEENNSQTDESVEIKKLNRNSSEESLEMDNSSQKSKNNIISFKALNLDDQVEEKDFENAEEKDKGYYSDGDIKVMKIAKNKQLLNVTLQDFEFISVLGVGGFGAVWLVSKKKTKDYYAMKVIDCRNKNMSEIQNLRAEKNVFEILEGDFVVKAFYSFIQDQCLLFLLEYMMGGDISQVLFQYGRLSEQVAKFYLAELLLAIESLHKKGIIHRDLKPQNILLDSQGHIKLADFGLSEIALVQKIKDGKDGINLSIDPEALPQNVSKRQIKIKCNLEFHMHNYPSKNSVQDKSSSGKRQNRIIGTPDYIPPEVISGQSISNFSIDWWAFGVIMYEFLVGIPPFNDKSIPKVFENITMRAIEWPEIGDGEDMISTNAYNLINKLLEPNYHIRLGHQGIEEIKKDPFFKDIDWVNIRNLEAPMIPIRDLEHLEEEQCNLLQKQNEENKMKDRLRSVQYSHDGKFDEVANLTRFDLLAKLSEQDAENVIKKQSNQQFHGK